ncbi:hypothetical protein ABL78_4568 [Leptomonas seymouri]|uniref:F-box domain-containing protein n=1 Tax=Leptomonas seymouri TaxID=5684 RepID=A0A0N1IK52_LEPSE|nr:hypothetical protein ABL78_4568 [Leptomonas seymouri]|eukprot:KPI86382.1 hypothetical protein ABL78_4568 [Leptomonas seymouri]
MRLLRLTSVTLPPFLLLLPANGSITAAADVATFSTRPAGLEQHEHEHVLKISSKGRHALSAKRLTPGVLRQLQSDSTLSVSHAMLRHVGFSNCSGAYASLRTSARPWCTTAEPLRASPAFSGSDEALKAMVLECIPRAPLYATTSAVQALVLQYEATQPTWGPPFSDAESQVDGDEKPQQLQRHRSRSSAGAFKGKVSMGSSVSASAPPCFSVNEGRLRRIRNSYGSFKGLMLAMALERLDGGGLRGNRSAEEGCHAANEAEEVGEVYRGGGRYGVYLSVDLMFATVASSALEAGLVFSNAYEPLTAQELFELQAALHDADPPASRKATSSKQARQPGSAEHSSSNAPTASGGDAVLDAVDVVVPEDYCCPLMPTSENALSRRERQVQQRSKLLSKTLRLRSVKSAEALIGLYIPYFGDDFTPPPPPPDLTASAAATTNAASPSPAQGKGAPAVVVPSTNTFTPLQIEALLPTFFVPMDALLPQLPAGYNAAHVRAIFSETGAVETVQVGGKSFIRFHGGKRGEGFSKDMLHTQQGCFDTVEPHDVIAEKAAPQQEHPSSSHAGSTETEMKLRRYIASFKPDPYLLHAFLPRFARPFQWVSLYDLVQHAPAAVQEKLLPLRQQLTLLYFAQQQQRVQFTSQNGGGVSLCCPPIRSLREETTPLPRVLAELRARVAKRGAVYVEELENDAELSLSDYTKRHIIAYFGTLRRFLFQHASVFRLSVFTSPATLYEASNQKAEEKEDEGGTQRATAAQGVASPAQTSSLAATAAGDTPAYGRHADGTDSGTSLSSLPRPGTGFITSASLPFQHNSADDSQQHAGESGASSDLHTDALRDVNFSGITHEEALLDADGFPGWLASRDLAVQLEDEAQLRDQHRVPLEERLETLEAKRARSNTRKARRRLAATANPNSPFSDPAVLLDAILRYLPPTRHVSLKALLAALPMSMRDFLPNDYVALFRNAPSKVQLFEYRRKNHLRVMRPGLPLPDGRLRASYTDEELLHLIAAQLPHGQSKHAVTIYGNLPYGARETVRLRHRHLVTFVERYPQYFVVVYKDVMKDLKHMARILLLEPPPMPENWSASDDALGSSMTAEELEAVKKADRAMLLSELSPELRETIESRRDV